MAPRSTTEALPPLTSPLLEAGLAREGGKGGRLTKGRVMLVITATLLVVSFTIYMTGTPMRYPPIIEGDPGPYIGRGVSTGHSVGSGNLAGNSQQQLYHTVDNAAFSMTISRPKLCDTSVNQASGYFVVDAASNKK